MEFPSPPVLDLLPLRPSGPPGPPRAAHCLPAASLAPVSGCGPPESRGAVLEAPEPAGWEPADRQST
ncbi:hypothetical protein KUCAC02_031719 [Chaenocephalus aceratus]|nr:hypothetical protein KUCAC02_031719 [Chaenocephalus aceratus]